MYTLEVVHPTNRGSCMAESLSLPRALIVIQTIFGKPLADKPTFRARDIEALTADTTRPLVWRPGEKITHILRATLYKFMVGLPGLEPGTSSLSVTRSNQLSYKPSLPLRCSHTKFCHQHIYVCS